MTYWHFNMRLLQKVAWRDCCEATFYLYLFLLFYSRVHAGYPFVLKFHGVTLLCALPIHGIIIYVQSCPTGNKYAWLWPYILSDCCTASINSVRQENPVALGNTILQALPGTSDFWFPSTVSYLYPKFYLLNCNDYFYVDLLLLCTLLWIIFLVSNPYHCHWYI